MTTHQALYLMVGEVKGELHYLKKFTLFWHIVFLFLINTYFEIKGIEASEWIPLSLIINALL